MLVPYPLVSLAAVFWMSRNARPKERCVTYKKRLRGRQLIPRRYDNLKHERSSKTLYTY